VKLSGMTCKYRPSPHWIRLAAVGVLAAVLAACGGSDGATGATGPQGPQGDPGATGPQGPAGVGALATVPSNTAPATTAAAAAWQALAPTVTVTGVTIASPPVVSFSVKDVNGSPVVGLGNRTQASTARVSSLANLSFTIAKLVPGAAANPGGTTQPSKWVTYLVTKPSTVAQAAGTIAASDSCDQVNGTAGATWCGTYPTSDSQGTLVDNGDGTYQYTFYRDIKQAATIVAGLNNSVDGLSQKADLGDLTYDGSLTHRVAIILSGNAPGTGTNTPNGVAFPATATGVPMINTANAWYDFVPSGGTPTTTRDIVVKDSCSQCHDGQGIGHAGSTVKGVAVGRNDPNLCVTCHTDQIKYSFNNPANTPNGEAPMTSSTASAFPNTAPNGTVNGFTFAGGGSTTAQKRANMAILNGRAVGNFPNLIHKTHMGGELVKQGYNFNNNGGAQMFNTVGFPQDPNNCTKCHNGPGSTTNGFTAVVTPDGNNWKNIPSALACGACHDGINFATGTGSRLADVAADTAASKPIGTTQTGHLGGVAATDAMCSVCHNAATVPVDVVHRNAYSTPNNLTAQAGVATFKLNITKVTVNASKQPVVTFQILQQMPGDAAPTVVKSLATPNLVTNAVTGQQVIDPAYQPIPGFGQQPYSGRGAPRFAPEVGVAFAVPADGIKTPADFNVWTSSDLAYLLIPSGSPKAGTLTVDASGNFTAVLTGDLVGQPKGAGCVAPVAPAVATCVNTAVAASPITVPANAKIVTGAIYGYFTQTGVSGYPYTAGNVAVNPNVNAAGGVNAIAQFVKLAVSSSDQRRVIVDSAKCNSCHDQLGTNPNFHAQVRNEATACNFCHNGWRNSSGWSADSSTFVHGIHGAGQRSVPFTWHAVSATDNYSMLQYPGVLKDCNQCHVPNTVNFGADGTTLLPNLLWSTTASGAFPNPPTTSGAYSNSPYIVNGTNYGTNWSYTVATGVTVEAASTTLVNSPISSACFACHDTSSARNHMVTNGGSIYETRAVNDVTPSTPSGVLYNAESCLVCHGAGSIVDAAVVHAIR